MTDEEIREFGRLAPALFTSGVHVANVQRDCEIALDASVPNRVRAEARKRVAAWYERANKETP